MKKTVILLLALIAGFGLRGQDSSDEALNLPKVIPPSPEVASLLEFNLAKVDEYTGGHSFNIPIFTLAKGSIQVPISLGYQSSGLRVDQVASRVGLGWSLNAGGVIGRTVLGYADEYGAKGFFSQYIANSGIYHENGDLNLGLVCDDNWDEDSRFLVLNDLASGEADAEADVYSYSLPNGQAGKFVFDKNRMLQKMEENELKIINPYTTVDGINDWTIDDWTVIDDQGNTYWFNGIEKTRDISGCSGGSTSQSGSNNPLIFTAWHLKKITSANGLDSVEFFYDIETQQYFSGKSETNYSHEVIVGSGDSPENYKRNRTCPQWLETETPVLRRITTSWGQEVVFGTSNEKRKDVEGDTYELKDITIFQKRPNSPVKERLKAFHLTQSYFKAKKNGVELSGEESDLYRLRLDQVWEAAADNQAMPPYVFTYADHGNFPKRLSNAQDYWGIFNGQEQNETLIALYGQEAEGLIFADRFPRKEFAEEGVITGVSYPNGGSMEFELELHEVPNDENLPERIRQSERLEQTGVGEQTFDFTLNSPTGSSSIIIDYLNTYFPPSNPSNNPDPGLDDKDGNMLSRSYVEISISGANLNFPHYFYTGDTNELLSLPNGSYTAKVKISNASQVSGKCHLQMDWYNYGSIPTNIKIGGLRIAKEIKRNGIQEDVQYVYNYVEGLTSDRSSGVNFQDFRFYYTEYGNDGSISESNPGCAVNNRWAYHVHQSSSLQPLGIGNGGHIGYSRVEKMAVSTTNQNAPLGKTVSYFLNDREVKSLTWSPNTGQIGNQQPDFFAVSELADIKNGKLIKQEVYSNNAGQLELKQQNTYEYEELGPTDKVYSMKVRFMETSGCKGCNYYKFENAGYWHTINSRFVLKSEKSITYTDEGSAIETQKDYAYDQSRTFMKSQTVIGSANDQLVTSYSYPHDFMANDAILSEMVSRNIVAVPIETSTTRNGQFVNKQRTEYFQSDNNFLPKTIYTTRAGASEEARVQFYHYTEDGNPLEFSKEGNIKHAIFWDGDGLRPLARVANAEHNQVWHTSFEKYGYTSDGAWTGNKAFQNPRISAPDLAAGNYTMTYWMKDPVNGWVFKSKQITATSQGYTGDLSGIIDEVRIYPNGAQMNTVTYDELGRVLTECDVTNRVIRYTYDGFGRLTSIKDEEGKLLKAFEYNYHNE